MNFPCNWLDAVILITLLITLVIGMRTGMIRTIFNIAAVVIGIVAAVALNKPVSAFILGLADLPPLAVEVFAFIVIFGLATVGVSMIGSVVYSITEVKVLKMVDRIGGAALGLIIGVLLLGFFLLLLSAFPVSDSLTSTIDDSLISSPLIDLASVIYDQFTGVLPFQLPQLSAYPETLGTLIGSTVGSYSYNSSVDFRELDQSTCIDCGSTVDFLGYENNGKGSLSPKYVCSGCGRTSDGCQTYEGYHALYEVCPVELSNQGYRFDCGIWSNGTYVRASGPCPVCGIE